jgi:quercetin dioxygenase-like cupin family protein
MKAIASTALTVLSALFLMAPSLPPGTIQFRSEELRWQDAPPTMPRGARIAILEGDPKQEGMFTVRLKLLAGSVVAPHTHPRDERVTILSGRVAVGFGRKVDRNETRRFGAGSFYVNPAGSEHYVLIEQNSVLQITGSGPWKVDPVK